MWAAAGRPGCPWAVKGENERKEMGCSFSACSGQGKEERKGKGEGIKKRRMGRPAGF